MLQMENIAKNIMNALKKKQYKNKRKKQLVEQL